jgi:hypothetical protein
MAARRISDDFITGGWKQCIKGKQFLYMVSLTLSEEYWLRLFENRLLRRIFGPKGGEVTGRRGKLHSEELHNLHNSLNIIKVIKSMRMRWMGYVARIGELRNGYKILVLKSEGKRPLGRPRRRWEDNIKIDLKAIGFEVVDWIHLG